LVKTVLACGSSWPLVFYPVWFWTAEAMGATTEDSDAPRSL
jgi:hypothetical protein